MTTKDLRPDEYNVYYARYVALVPDHQTILEALADSRDRMLAYLDTVPEDRKTYAYAPGKWTIAESLQHLTDSERIFSTRALRISRGDRTPLPGFDQDEYVAAMDVSHLSLADLRMTFEAERAATIRFYQNLAPASAPLSGTASDSPVTVRALGFLTAGHCYHHVNLYRERYA